MDKDDISVGTGLVGAPACGDVMKLQVGDIHIQSNLSLTATWGQNNDSDHYREVAGGYRC